LRATFGMNLVDSLKPLVDSGEMTYTDMLEYVRARMSHEDSKTTTHYLKYRERSKRFTEIQNTFENKVLELIEVAMGNDL